MIIDSRTALLQHAAEDPLTQFVNNRVDQLLTYFDLPDPDLDLVPLVREAYLRGMRDGNTKIGELL